MFQRALGRSEFGFMAFLMLNKIIRQKSQHISLEIISVNEPRRLQTRFQRAKTARRSIERHTVNVLIVFAKRHAVDIVVVTCRFLLALK